MIYLQKDSGIVRANQLSSCQFVDAFLQNILKTAEYSYKLMFTLKFNKELKMKIFLSRLQIKLSIVKDIVPALEI